MKESTFWRIEVALMVTVIALLLIGAFAFTMAAIASAR